ncbi:WXG100 family type VII secretion target [Streptomyces sp. NPDC002870]|uniref:WXG100 family type VII secretion target n=1 Tax=Streptomyces sp. NPDC002870 TaxID=3364666 RepID=UPI0036B027B8
MPDFTDGIIHVEYSHTENAAENLMSQTVAIETTLDNLEQELVALITWEGEDKTAYVTIQSEWNNAVVKMKDDLLGNKVLLEDITDNYRRSEQRLVEAFLD